MKDRTIIWIVIIGLLFWLMFVRPPKPVRRAMRAAGTFVKGSSPKDTKRPQSRKAPEPPAPQNY